MLNKEKHSPGNFCAPVQPTTMSGIGDHFEGEIQVQLRNMNLDDVEADEVEADEGNWQFDEMAGEAVDEMAGEAQPAADVQQVAQGKRAAKQPRRSNPLLAIDDMEDDQEVEDKEGDLLFGKTAFVRMPNGT